MTKQYKFILTLPNEVVIDSVEEIHNHMSWPNWSQADPVRYRGIFDSYEVAKEYASKFKIYKYILLHDGYDSYEDEEEPRYFISYFDAEDAVCYDLDVDSEYPIIVNPSRYVVEKINIPNEVYKYSYYYRGTCVYDSKEDDEYFELYEDAEEAAEDGISQFCVEDVFDIVPIEILDIRIEEV
jgi:hypothetical protein